MDADEKEYPTELVSIDFFGGKKVEAGNKETVKIVSVDDAHAQIRCVGSKSKAHGNGNPGKAMAGKYNSKMNEGGSY